MVRVRKGRVVLSSGRSRKCGGCVGRDRGSEACSTVYTIAVATQLTPPQCRPARLPASAHQAGYRVLQSGGSQLLFAELRISCQVSPSLQSKTRWATVVYFSLFPPSDSSGHFACPAQFKPIQSNQSTIYVFMNSWNN